MRVNFTILFDDIVFAYREAGRHLNNAVSLYYNANAYFVGVHFHNDLFVFVDLCGDIQDVHFMLFLFPNRLFRFTWFNVMYLIVKKVNIQAANNIPIIKRA